MPSARAVHASTAPGACEGERDDCRRSCAQSPRLCGMSHARARISPRSCNHVSAGGSRGEGGGAQDLESQTGCIRGIGVPRARYPDHAHPMATLRRPAGSSGNTDLQRLPTARSMQVQRLSLRRSVLGNATGSHHRMQTGHSLKSPECPVNVRGMTLPTKSGFNPAIDVSR